MKKIMTLFVAFILLTGILPSVFAQNTLATTGSAITLEIPTYTPRYVCGDVNGDGIVSVIDIDIIPRVEAGLARWGERADLTKADVNGNGRVDLGDSGYIARMVSGEVRGMCPIEEEEIDRQTDDRCEYNIERGETFTLISPKSANSGIKIIYVTYSDIDAANKEIKFKNQNGNQIISTYAYSIPASSSSAGRNECRNSIGKGILIIEDGTYNYYVGPDMNLFFEKKYSERTAETGNNGDGEEKEENKEKIRTELYKRKISEDKKTEAYNNFINAKEKFADANKNYNKLKKELIEIKEESKKICENEESEMCSETRAKTFEIGRALLLKGTESAIEHLKQIIARIDASEDVSKEDAEQRLNELNTYIGSLFSLKEMTEKATTMEELKNASKKLETMWALIKFDSKALTVRLINDKLLGIYSRAKAVKSKFECSLDSVSDEKKKELISKLEKYEEFLEESRKIHNKAIVLMNSAIAGKSLEQIEESKNLMFESYKIIKNSQGLLISIFNEFKNAGGDPGYCNKSY